MSRVVRVSRPRFSLTPFPPPPESTDPYSHPESRHHATTTYLVCVSAPPLLSALALATVALDATTSPLNALDCPRGQRRAIERERERERERGCSEILVVLDRIVMVDSHGKMRCTLEGKSAEGWAFAETRDRHIMYPALTMVAMRNHTAEWWQAWSRQREVEQHAFAHPYV